MNGPPIQEHIAHALSIIWRYRYSALQKNASERLDAGLRMADEFIQAHLTDLELPPGLSEEERVQAAFRALRALGS